MPKALSNRILSTTTLILGGGAALAALLSNLPNLPDLPALPAELLAAAAGLGMVLGREASEAPASELNAGEQQLRQITDALLDLVGRVDTEGRLLWISPSHRTVLGYPREQLLGTLLHDYIHPDDRELVAVQRAVMTRDWQPFRLEIRCRHAEGHYLWLDVAANPVWDDSGNWTGLVYGSRDITAYKTGLLELRDSRQRLDDIISFLPDAILVVDTQGTVITWNRAMEEMTGVPAAEMLGRGEYAYALPFYGERRPLLVDLVLGEHPGAEAFYPSLQREEGMLVAETMALGSDEEAIYLWARATPLYDADGQLVGAIESIRDITHSKRAEQQLLYLSLHDPLTGLYNRAYFEQELRRLEEEGYDCLSLLVCDIDGLKLVNDTLGHETGNAVIIAAAHLIRKCFREHDVVARLGGDEFAILLPNSPPHLAEVAYRRIQEAVRDFNQERREFSLSISVGFSATNAPGRSLDEMFREADHNMYREKLYHNQHLRAALIQPLLEDFETRDYRNRDHTDRIKLLVSTMAEWLDLGAGKTRELCLLARYHDVGKVGIDEDILSKPGRLDPEERTQMQRHCEIGYRIALACPELAPIATAILYHHEWWNGAGYPLGLKEEEIPVESRILAICDAYDAMTSPRTYRQPVSSNEALAEIKRFSGVQFDPNLSEIFTRVVDNEE